jgi:hypothetical protein
VSTPAVPSIAEREPLGYTTHVTAKRAAAGDRRADGRPHEEGRRSEAACHTNGCGGLVRILLEAFQLIGVGILLLGVAASGPAAETGSDGLTELIDRYVGQPGAEAGGGQ